MLFFFELFSFSRALFTLLTVRSSLTWFQTLLRYLVAELTPVFSQSNFVGCIAICDLIKTTLGPKGMDKILQSSSNLSDVQVTNDGGRELWEKKEKGKKTSFELAPSRQNARIFPHDVFNDRVL